MPEKASQQLGRLLGSPFYSLSVQLATIHVEACEVRCSHVAIPASADQWIHLAPSGAPIKDLGRYHLNAMAVCGGKEPPPEATVLTFRRSSGLGEIDILFGEIEDPVSGSKCLLVFRHGGFDTFAIQTGGSLDLCLWLSFRRTTIATWREGMRQVQTLR